MAGKETTQKRLQNAERMASVGPATPLASSTGGKARMKRRDYLKQTIESLKTHPTSECVKWPFACSASSGGYGYVRTDEKLVTVHRLAFELYHGKPAAQCVLHHCDNPKCFNPLHLYEGDAYQNRMDTVRRGPSPYTANIRHPRVKRNGNQ